MTSTVKPITKQIDLFQFADFAQVIQWRDNGVPVNLSGWTFDGMIRLAYDDAQPAAVFEVVVLDVSGGYIEIRLTDAQTAGLTADTYVYDVRATLGSLTQQLVRGKVKVQRGATRA